MKDFKQFIKALAVVLAALLTIIASAGAIMVGGIYTFAGILNFGWLFFPIREVVKHLNARKSKPEGFVSGGLSESKEVKTERQDINKSDKI